MDNSPILTGFITEITEEGLQISNDSDILPIIHYNTTVRISIFNNVLGFKILVGKVYLSTREIIRLIDVQSAADYEKRQFFRMKISVPGKVALVTDDPEKKKLTEPFPVTIRDISLSGLLFVSDKQLKIADQATVSFKILNAPFQFLCKIVRSFPVELGTADGYGCEFLDNTGIQYDLLCKCLFDLQREQIRAMKNPRQ